MAQTAESQSYLRRPLDVLFSSEATVRVLRELVLQEEPMPTSLLAQRARLSVPGARKAVRSLLAAGIVREFGHGRSIMFEVDTSHPLTRLLQLVFVREHKRFSDLLDQMRDALADRPQGIEAIWLYGSVARGDDSVTSDIDVAVVVEDDERVESLVDSVRGLLGPLIEREHLHLSVIGLSHEDAIRLSSEADPLWRDLVRDALALVGPRPRDIVRGTAPSSF